MGRPSTNVEKSTIDDAERRRKLAKHHPEHPDAEIEEDDP